METEQAKQVVSRLKGLRGYEKLAEELLKIAEKYGKNHSHLFQTISEIIESETVCPTPAALRGYLTAGRTKEDDRWKGHRVCPLGLCVGDGWRVHYSLHTRTEHGTTKERISAEQAEDLRGKIDAKTQTVYEGVAPCAYRGGGDAA